jgi:hypothetical protein
MNNDAGAFLRFVRRTGVPHRPRLLKADDLVAPTRTDARLVGCSHPAPRDVVVSDRECSPLGPRVGGEMNAFARWPPAEGIC